MSSIVGIFDPYERRARLYPMLLVLAPCALGLASWLPFELEPVSLSGSAVLGFVAAAFLSQLARDRGRKKESELFRRWGGVPSIQALSHSSGFFDKISLNRYHKKLHEYDPNLIFPTSWEEEEENRAEAEANYLAANEILRKYTQSRGDFSLVFEENINYGYRRNLWAMKSFGIVFALLGLMSGAYRIARGFLTGSIAPTSAFVAFFVSGSLLVAWLILINPSWVRVAADAYARQLVSASDIIGPSRKLI